MIVLDLALPDLDGIDVCRRIRQRSDVPILMLTARDDDIDKIIGLEVVRTTIRPSRSTPESSSPG